MELSEKLRYYRKKANLTQREAGIAIGCKENCAQVIIGKYERGEHIPSWTYMVKLAKLYGINIACFSDDFGCDDATVDSLKTDLSLLRTQNSALSRENAELLQNLNHARNLISQYDNDLLVAKSQISVLKEVIAAKNT
jgi:transcriptional regulator with XRE-family HTH domain